MKRGGHIFLLALCWFLLPLHAWSQAVDPEMLGDVGLKTIGKIRVSAKPLRFGGPQIILHQGEQEVEITSLVENSEMLYRMSDPKMLQKTKTLTPSAMQTRFRLTLEGQVEKAHRLLFDGEEVKLTKQAWKKEVIVQPGNNEFAVFLYDPKNRFSNFLLEVHLLDYRPENEKYYQEPVIVVKEVARTTGFVVDIGTTTGTFSLENIERDPLVTTMNLGVKAAVEYWLSPGHLLFRDLGIYVSYWHHLNFMDGAIAPSIYHGRAGGMARFYFLDDPLSPWVYASVGGFLYHFNDNDATALDPMGVYAMVGGELPLIRRFGLTGEFAYSLVPQAGNTTRMLDLGAGLYFKVTDGSRVRATATYQGYNVFARIDLDPLVHTYVTYALSYQLDL